MSDSGYVTEEQDDAIWAVIKNPDSHFWFDIPPLVGKETLQKIDRLCFENDVYFITNRYGAAAKRDTERWLKWHGIGLPTVVVTGTSLSGAEQKARLVKGIGIEFAIDDRWENVYEMSNHCWSFIMNRNHNTNYTGLPYLRRDNHHISLRVNSIEEFLERIPLLYE